MNLEDFDEFSKVVLGFAELRGKQLSSPAVKLYFNALSDWTLEEFKQAAVHLLKSSQYMPTPYEFTQLRRAGELKPGEAWELVLSGAALDPNSRAYRAAQIVGGQYYIRHADVERDLPFIERRFLEAYKDLTDVEPTREALPQIAKPPARIALRGPVQVGAFAPKLEQPRARKADNPRLPAPKPAEPVAEQPKPSKSPREKVAALVKLHADFTPEDIARIAGESVETVREVMAELEHAAA